jgi:hypothetical protein
MDNQLQEIIEKAIKRGNRYVKGQTTPYELPEKIAELGVLFLEKSHKLAAAGDERFREELIEIQNKIDDLRKSIFNSKGQIS